MVKVLVNPEQYLHAVFEGPDCEYVDGGLVERALPNLDHSEIQARFIEIIYDLKKRLPLLAFPEVRHKLSETCYRIPDVAIHLQRPAAQVPDTPPFAAIEIISPDDRFSAIQSKLLEYEEWGVKHIWVVDPNQRTLSVFQDSALKRVEEFRLPEFDITIEKSAILPAAQSTSDTLKS